MTNKTFKDTRVNKMWKVIEIVDTKVKMQEIGTNNFRTLGIESPLFTDGTYVEVKLDEVKEKVHIPCTKKVNRVDNEQKMDAFKQSIATILENPYSTVWEANKKKLIIRYTDEKSGKFRNILELFYKTRFNDVFAFIRETELMEGIEYDAQLAESNKSRSYNFWIEKHLTNNSYSEHKELVIEFVKKIIVNHKATLETIEE